MTKKEKLPDFDTSKLANFIFGDPEAKTDEILSSCFQKVRGVEEFLSGSKTIVLGERGAGKSALFKLISEGALAFKTEKEKVRKTIVIPIDDDLEYLAIANVIEERFSDQTKRRHGKYRYLWELYILSRIADSLYEDNREDLEAQTLRDDIGEVLGLPKKTGFRLRDLFTAYKLTLGSKMDPSGAVTPSVSIEPAKDAKLSSVTVSDHEIARLKERLRRHLRAKSTVAIVLIDRIDDFVVGTAYEEQLNNIQALVDCIKDFRLPEMKLKIFLRTDLFKRINFAHGGYDKIAPQIVHLEWTQNDICEFVARRLVYNYKRLDIKVRFNDLDIGLLDVDPVFSEQLRDILKLDIKGVSDAIHTLYRVAVVAVRVRLARLKIKSHTARQTDLAHAVVMRLITHVFPLRVHHFNCNCQREEIPIATFISTHFKLGGENPNPRLVLLFLSFTFTEAAYYYSRNPDKSRISANDLDEYEVILKEHIQRGYRNLQDTARKTVAHLNPDRRKYVDRLFSNLDHPKKCQTLTFEKLKVFSGWDLPDEDFRAFIAFFTHIGLLVPDNPTLQFEKRSFSLPVIMSKYEEQRI